MTKKKKRKKIVVKQNSEIIFDKETQNIKKEKNF